MKIILETAEEVLEAFENLSQVEKHHFLIALKKRKLVCMREKERTLNPLDFFGLWQGQNVDVHTLRKEAWNERI